MRLSKNKKKITITPMSWARSAKSNTYIHVPTQKFPYKIGEIVLAAIGLSFGVSEQVGFVMIEKIDKNGNLHLKLIEKSPSLMERVGRK